MTTAILYLSDQLTACPSPWRRPSHLQGHTYSPQGRPGHCPRNKSLSVCTWKSKARVMSPVWTLAPNSWKPLTYHLSVLRINSFNKNPFPKATSKTIHNYFTETIKKYTNIYIKVCFMYILSELTFHRDHLVSWLLFLWSNDRIDEIDRFLTQLY